MRRTQRQHAHVLFSAVLTSLSLALPRSTAAQTNSPETHPARDEPNASVCLGFSFGRWTPALNWHEAGHTVAFDSASVPRTDGGLGWAVQPTTPADTVLMLFPPWWPAGVSVALPTRTPAQGDTIAGIAAALIPDDRGHRAPMSHVRAWRVRCGG